MDALNCYAIKTRMKQRNRSNERNSKKRKEKLSLAEDVLVPQILTMKMGPFVVLTLCSVTATIVPPNWRGRDLTSQ